VGENIKAQSDRLAGEEKTLRKESAVASTTSHGQRVSTRQGSLAMVCQTIINSSLPPPSWLNVNDDKISS